MAQDRQTNGSGERDRGIVDTMLELGEATTLFTLDQMQTAATMLVDPSKALDHMKDSMATLTKAMKKTTSRRRTENGDRESGTDPSDSMRVRRGTVETHDMSTTGRKV